VPEALRGKLWIKLLKVQETSVNYSYNTYSKLKEMPNQEVEDMLQKDVDRTMSELKLWREEILCGNNKLFNVLKAFANLDTEVSYVQGLNYIVAIMLIYIQDEETVFWCLVFLMNNKNWREVYTKDFPKLKSMCRTLEKRMKIQHPEVLRHLLNNEMITEGTFAAHFMTLFVYLTPIEIATRLFELFVIDGESALVEVLLRMIGLKKAKILSLADGDLIKYMQRGMIIECTEEFPISALFNY